MSLEEIIERLNLSITNRAENYANQILQEFQNQTGEQAPDLARKSLVLGYIDGYKTCLKDTLEITQSAQRQCGNPEDN